ncbi:MAG TPA: hypothetical protein VLA46_04265, partial [Saprospiraceae bacterium]|nr:hypothetical protein [Saprospiraceae bacterium]
NYQPCSKRIDKVVVEGKGSKDHRIKGAREEKNKPTIGHAFSTVHSFLKRLVPADIDAGTWPRYLYVAF